MEKPRAVIYIRVSDPSQIENNSLETQLKTCQGYAERSGLEVVKTFSEEGVSAKTTAVARFAGQVFVIYK